MDQLSGEVVPASCGANFCSVCGRRNASETAGAIGLASPDRFILLTDCGGDWQTRRARTNRLVHDLRGEFGPMDVAWHGEPNPKETGHHEHMFQRGASKIPQRALSSLARRRGFGGICFIRRWRPAGPAAHGYGLKLAGVGYGMKMAEAEESLGVYLGENGGRLVHGSRGFWRDENGERCTLGAAREAFVRTLRTEDVEREWVRFWRPEWDCAEA